MSSQQETIKNFIQAIKKETRDCDGFDVGQFIDRAVRDFTNSKYACMQNLVTEFIDKLGQESLKDLTGIDFDNNDCGSILGIDAGTSTEYTVQGIINETGTATYPTDNKTVVDNLTFIYPEQSALSTQEQYVVSCLNTWWIKLAIDITKESIGLKTLKEQTIDVKFNKAETKLDCADDMTHYYLNIEDVSSIDMSTYDGIIGTKYLDRIVAKEIAKLVMYLEIGSSKFFEDYIKYGICNIVVGGDEYKDEINYILEHKYDWKNHQSAFGYMLFRWIAKEFSDEVFETGQHRDLQSERGYVSNYLELARAAEKFFTKKGNEEVSEWELLDNRIDSFYGTTIKIPLSDYEIDKSNKDNILIIGDNKFINKYSTNSDYTDYYYNKNRLDKILKKVFPSANITVVNNASNRLEFVKDYLSKNSVSNCKLIFDGAEQNYVEGMSLDGTEALLNDIQTYCESNNVETILMSLPAKNIKTGTSTYGLDFHLIPDNNIFIQEELFTYSNGNWSDIYFKDIMYTTNSELPNETRDKDFCLEYQCNPLVYNFINTMIMNNIFKKQKECIYLSMMYQNVASTTYRDFVWRSDEYCSEEYPKYHTYPYSTHTKYGGSYENPFKDSGEFISIGLHRTFDYGLWMCEQGSITCEYENDRQINDLNLMKAWVFYHGAPYKSLDLPVYPTTGCPWLTHSKKDMFDYNISSSNKIIYYFTKTSTSGSITVRFIDVNKQKPDTWQTIEFGIQDRVQHKYEQAPMYVAGGNQALSPDGWNYWNQSWEYGLQYDLSIQNICFSNANLLSSCKLHSANMSNYRTFGQGKWRDIYHLSQDYTVKHYAGCDSTYNNGWLIQKPVEYNYQYGAIRNYADSSMIVKDYKQTTPYYRHNISHNILYYLPLWCAENGGFASSVGSIQKAYFSPSLTVQQGINKFNDNRYYLVIPQGWEERLYYYPQYCGESYEHPVENVEIYEEATLPFAELAQDKTQQKLVLDYNVEQIVDDSNYINVSNDVDVNMLIHFIKLNIEYDYLILYGYSSIGKDDFSDDSNQTFTNDLLVVHNGTEYREKQSDIVANKQLIVSGGTSLDLKILVNTKYYSNKLVIGNDITLTQLQQICDNHNMNIKLEGDCVCHNGFALIKHFTDDSRPTETNLYKVVECIPDSVQLNKNTLDYFSTDSIFKVDSNEVIIPYTKECQTNKQIKNITTEVYRYKIDKSKVVKFENGYKNLLEFKIICDELYLPPTLNTVDLKQINAKDIYMYSNKRVNLIHSYSILDDNDEYFEDGVLKEKDIKIHLRQSVYDFAILDYPELADKLVVL